MPTIETLVSDDVPVTVVSPDGAPDGGVIVVQEAFGITDHIVDICRRTDSSPRLRTCITALGIPFSARIRLRRRCRCGGSWARRSLPGSGCCVIGGRAGPHCRILHGRQHFYGGGLSESRWQGVPSGLDTASTTAPGRTPTGLRRPMSWQQTLRWFETYLRVDHRKAGASSVG